MSPFDRPLSRRGLLGGLAALVLLAPSGASAGERRIVSLAPSVTEALFAIGAGPEIVGVTTFCDFPAAARALPRVGDYLSPNVEAIVALRPTVVLAVPSPGNRAAVETLERMGLRVVVVSEGPGLEDVFGAIAAVATTVGRGREGEDLVTRLRGEVAEVRRRVAGRKRPRVLVLVGRDPLVAVGRGTLIGELVDVAGGENVAAGLGAWPRLGIEAVIETDPEVILDTAMGTEAGNDGTHYRGLGLRAVREGRVHTLQFDELLRPGPRLVVGLAEIARRLHPDAFPENPPPGAPDLP